ncbi:cytochrome c [Pistricoccus aurantiacus]|uniref:Cytochrome c n=1 Tax=Pistricoccus aurantiacus TaxID=1883414 RepID=A0A5B8SPI8_9GAMM|nr:cbb3-type cytochrome c oxidase subunit II [Pistricoccus aurantiacus]QEA38231.1 cytochrome c [Pistricoccus aurantiacus]
MNFHRNHWLLLGTIFFGFIGLAFIIAILPAQWMQQNTEPLPEAEPLSDLEQRGLEVYIAEGCVACHTQQVRPLPMDQPWGRPTAAADYALLGPMDVWRPYSPAVLGSARTGPDLSNIGARQSSETWQYLHLYNPRAVVKDSIMPAYPWLFEPATGTEGDAPVVTIPEAYAPEDGKVVPTEQGQALVAYLLALRQIPIEGAGGTTQEASAETDQKGVPAEESEGQAGAKGDTLYANNCASCHQANGQGLPGTFPPLAGNSLVLAEDPGEHIDTILHGAQGRTIDGTEYASPMPGFADQLDDDQIAAIVNHERTSWGNDAPAATAEDVAGRREAGEK